MSSSPTFRPTRLIYLAADESIVSPQVIRRGRRRNDSLPSRNKHRNHPRMYSFAFLLLSKIMKISGVQYSCQHKKSLDIKVRQINIMNINRYSNRGCIRRFLASAVQCRRVVAFKYNSWIASSSVSIINNPPSPSGSSDQGACNLPAPWIHSE
jgi:hypothetical protein